MKIHILSKKGKFRTTVYPNKTPATYEITEQFKRCIQEIDARKSTPVLKAATFRPLLLTTEWTLDFPRVRVPRKFADLPTRLMVGLWKMGSTNGPFSP